MKKPEHITLIESEIADFKQRAQQAQREQDDAQRQAQAFQIAANTAREQVVAYGAAAQAFGIALSKLTAPKPKPAKKGPQPNAKPSTPS